ncbi:disco-interacting protein 2 homolog B, partial [Tachysurus ichikawai]
MAAWVLLIARSGKDEYTGDITQKGYEKKRAKLLAPYIPHTQ